MSENPYAPPTDGRRPPSTGWQFVARVLLTLLKYFGCYLLGIFLCVILTDAEFVLAGLWLLPAYVLLSVVGCFLWFVSAFQALPSIPFEMWWVLLMLAMPCVGETLAYRYRGSNLRNWRPMWFGLPVGFVGTLGIYWVGSLSI